MSNSNDADVIFSGSDILMLIAHLTNAVTFLGTATKELAQGHTTQALKATAASGEKVDEIVRLIQTKVAEVEAAHNGR